MAKIPVSKYPNQAGYLQFDTNTNEVEVFSDGKFKSVTENSEYFNIYKHSKLLFESTTSFYGKGHFIIDLSTMKGYIIARKATAHGISPTQIVKIDITTKAETILLDGTTSPTKDYAPDILFYYNNIPYLLLTQRNVNPLINEKTLIINALTGAIIKEDSSIVIQPESYIIINNDLYICSNNSTSDPRGTAHYILKYSPSLNTFTVLNTWTTTDSEFEQTLGKINGKLFMIARNEKQKPTNTFTLYQLNNDWTIKNRTLLNFNRSIQDTTPYVFRKGNQILFTYMSRGYEQTGGLFLYQILEKNDNYFFNLKNIYYPLNFEDYNSGIYPTGYQFPTILPFSKTGIILVEDRRSIPVYKTRLYKLHYDNDISVDYTNF